jgi:glycosyltransferase involved in cell wall biosynthesis
MKIVVTVRTRNESRNIGRFIETYLAAGVDLILVSDVISTDNTVAIAARYSKVIIDYFTERVYGNNGLWRSPEGAHINSLIDWAVAEGADWIIHNDCDSVPNIELQKNLRHHILECDIMRDYGVTVGVVQATLIYMYGQDQYFPELNKPGPSLYAWHKDAGIRFSEVDPWNVDLVSQEPIKRGTYDISFPACCLHYFCPDPETMMAKHNFYKNSGQQPSHQLPTESCGPLKPIKDWMRWR